MQFLPVKEICSHKTIKHVKKQAIIAVKITIYQCIALKFEVGSYPIVKVLNKTSRIPQDTGESERPS